MMKKLLLILLSVLLVTGVVACDGTAKSDDANGQPSQTEPPAQTSESAQTSDGAILPIGDMTFELADTSGIEIKEYNLGEGVLKTTGKNGLMSNGKPVPCPLDGIIALPKGDGPHPLVMVVHGVQPATDTYKDKNYQGFDFLVKQLAAQGFVAVAYNHNAEYHEEQYGEADESGSWGYDIYRQQIEMLTKANAGSDPGYGIDLKGKIDMENVSLIGHSAGGGAIWKFAEKEAEQGKNTIKSLLFIAPAADLATPPNIPLGILLGEKDEQSSLAGAGILIFDDAKADKERTAPAQVTYIRGATHAYFNRKFELIFDTKEEKASYEASAHLSREQQEDFFLRYVCQFLDIYALNKSASAIGTYDTTVPEPGKMYGMDVTASFWSPESEKIVSPQKDTSNLSTSAGATAEYVVQEIGDKVLFFNHGGGMKGDLPLYRLRWTEKGGSVTFTSAKKDFSKNKALTIYTATIPSDELNSKGEGQSFSVVIKDASGKESSVVVPKGTSALSWYPGEKVKYESLVEDEPGWEYWAGETPLCDLRVPTALFKDIDLANVETITLKFDQTGSGAVMVSEISAE